MSLPDKRKEERWEVVYNQINGAYVPGVCEDVKDETSEGGELALLVKQIYEARNRISERMGVDPATDEDFEDLVGGFEDFSCACGKLMYHCGYQDGVNEKWARTAQTANQEIYGMAVDYLSICCVASLGMMRLFPNGRM